jgi:hypothetical protein
MKLRHLFLPALLVLPAQAESKPNQIALFEKIVPILQDLSQITGWKIERPVPAETLSRDKFRKTMESGMKDNNKKEIHAEETTLKMFGLVPPSFDLLGETVDLMSEQAAAFYDYKKKRLFVLDSTLRSSGSDDDEGEAELTLAHELAHALADQHHPLGKYMDAHSPDDDAAAARQAVMEGQASWLSWAYINKIRGGKSEVPAALLEKVAGAAGATGDDFPVLSGAPIYIRDSLTFPYNQGTRFDDAVYRKLGKAGFDQVFTHPPASTQQIMHPSAYFAGIEPVMVKPPELKDMLGKQGGDFRAIEEGVRGEFDYSELLRQYIGEQEGASAAAHIRGDAFRLYENKHDKSTVLLLVSEWDTPASAQKFVQLYRRVLQKKWKKMEIAKESPDGISGSGDDGRFQIRISGSTVHCLEGLK